MASAEPLDLPYEIHTNRELEFMLDRGKPLAHFSDAYPPLPPEEIIPRKAFAPHVANGRLDMRVYVAPLSEGLRDAPHVRGIVHFLYAQHSEAWRIDAYIAMQTEAERLGWSERFERLQGTLLGYSCSQNDAHIERMLKSPHAENFPWLRELLAKRPK